MQLVKTIQAAHLAAVKYDGSISYKDACVKDLVAMQVYMQAAYNTYHPVDVLTEEERAREMLCITEKLKRKMKNIRTAWLVDTGEAKGKGGRPKKGTELTQQLTQIPSSDDGVAREEA